MRLQHIEPHSLLKGYISKSWIIESSGQVSNAGGQVIIEKMFMSAEAGYIGMLIDTEGNKIGLQNL